MNKKTQTKCIVAGWLVSVAVLGVIYHFQRKKRLREEMELAKTTNDFAEKLANGLTEELRKKKMDELFNEEQMIPYGTDLNDISVTGTYRVSNQMKADNNPRHYLIIPGIVVQQILDAERNKKEEDAAKARGGLNKEE